MTRSDSHPGGSETSALVGVATLLTREAIALCREAVPGHVQIPALERAARQARELDIAVAQDRTDARTLAWALELAAVTLTEARREVAAARSS